MQHRVKSLLSHKPPFNIRDKYIQGSLKTVQCLKYTIEPIDYDDDPKSVCQQANAIALQNEPLAVFVWEQLLLNNERNSFYSLANYVGGLGNTSLHKSLLTGASDLGHYEASFKLGQMDRSLEMFEKALAGGMLQAHNEIAHILMESDLDKAVDHLRQGSDQGDPYCKFSLANLAATGKVNQDAFKLWSEVAESDDLQLASRALCNMANSCFLGLHQTVSYKTALSYWNLAFKLNRQNLLAWLHAANVYYDGIVDGKDYEKAAWLYEQLLDEAGIAGIEPSYQETSPLDQSKDIVNIASLLLQSCYRELGLIAEHSVQEVDSLEQASRDIQETIELNKFRNRTYAQMLINPDNPDYDKKQVMTDVDEQSDRNAETLAKQRKWKYVELFENTVKK